MTEQELKAMLEHAERRGIEQGIRLMQERMVLACENGNPISINGKAYFIKSDMQNLQDIFADIDAEYGVQRRKKYIVPIYRGEGEKYVERMAVIIEANTPDEAMIQAVFSFGYGGWIVDRNSKDYKTME